MSTPEVNLWSSAEHALDYLRRADTIPHRTEGEAELLEWLPRPLRNVLDLGSGAGRLLDLVLLARPEAQATALDFSPVMLEQLQARFSADPRITIVAHDLDRGLTLAGPFEAIVSSFAIHHVSHQRKRALYEEVFRLLAPGGVFLNLEHVASPTLRLHHEFLRAIGIGPADEDQSNKLLALETQLDWLSDIGFVDVDCHWKWRELALLAAVRPAA